MTFCPQSAVWGDVATWAGAIATLAAVIVALVTARRAGNIAFQIRQDERAEQRVKEDSLRHQLAIAFDTELYMALAQLDFFCDNMKQALAKRDAGVARVVLEVAMPAGGLPIVTTFVDSLYVFPVTLAGELLAILSRWKLQQEAPSGDPDPDEADVLRQGATILRAFQALASDMRSARLRVREHVLPGVNLTPLEESVAGDRR